MQPATKIHINPYLTEECWQYRWRPASDQPPDYRRQHHTRTRLTHHTRHHPPYKTGRHIEAHTGEREGNTTSILLHPRTVTQTQQYSYHPPTYQNPFNTKTSTSTTPTASIAKKQNTSRISRGASRNAAALTAINKIANKMTTILTSTIIPTPPSPRQP